jgi:CxxC-x17-CxxC domain-containing protein
MRHVLAPAREDREGEWIIAATRTVIDPVFAGKRLTNDAAEKAREAPWSKTSHLRHPKSYKVLCSGCGKEVVTQVPPPNGKKLLCMECFSK